MELHHCTEFEALREVLQLEYLKIGDLTDFPQLMKLGVRGVWLSTAAYGDQFFGPYRFTLDAATFLPMRFLVLSKTKTSHVLLASHSPLLGKLAELLKLELVHASEASSPLCLGSNGWSATGKVDVVCDFPIPISQVVRITPGTSLWTRSGKAVNALSRMNPQTGARLASLLLHGAPTALDAIFAKDAEDLACQLFRVLHGLHFGERANETRGRVPPEQLQDLDIVAAATECLLKEEIQDAMLLASLTDSDEVLAQRVADAVNKRFNISSVRLDTLLAC